MQQGEKYIDTKVALLQAIYVDEFDEAIAIIEENVDNIIDVPDENGVLPIHFVTDLSAYDEINEDTKQQMSKVALALIKKGARLDIPLKGMLPMHYAAYNGRLEVLQAIKNKGFDLSTTDESGFDCLYYAQQKEHTSLIEYISSVMHVVGAGERRNAFFSKDEKSDEGGETRHRQRFGI